MVSSCPRYAPANRVLRRLLPVLPVLLLFLASLPASAQRVFAAGGTLERAVLAEDWSTVAGVLVPIADADAPPAAPFIRGHALLALNRNSESLRAFVVTSPDEAHAAWLSWAETFVAEHPRSAIAHYFHGDALARLGRWYPAITAFDAALRQTPDHALSLNARGVAFVATGEWARSRLDFAEALRIDPRLADAQANVGFRLIDRQGGAAGAERAFDAALEISPSFALALHGRGLVRLVRGASESAERDLLAAQQHAEFAEPLYTSNLFQLQKFWLGLSDEDIVAMASAEDAGTTVNVSWDRATADVITYQNNSTAANYSRAVSSFRRLPVENRDAFNSQVFQPILDRVSARESPELTSSHMQNYDRTVTTLRAVTQASGDARRGAVRIATAVGVSASGGLTPPGLVTAVGGTVAVFAISQQHRWLDNRIGASQSANRDIMRARNLSPTAPPSVPGRSISPAGQPGGVAMSFDAALWDDGEWPFHAFYGLHYDTSGSWQ